MQTSRPKSPLPPEEIRPWRFPRADPFYRIDRFTGIATLSGMSSALYHLGFGPDDLPAEGVAFALLSGDPGRARQIADDHMEEMRPLSENRGLHSYLGRISGQWVLSATSGMGAPSLSIIVNELIQVGVKAIVRVGTCGSIQPHVKVGDVVVSSGALCQQGAANDIAPAEYPAVADPFLTVSLARIARELGIAHHVGITASLDTFYEGQERTDSANPTLLPSLRGRIAAYRELNVLNMEMEAATLFKMASVYGFRAACVCAVIAQRTESEQVVLDRKGGAVDNAIRLAAGCVGQTGE